MTTIVRRAMIEDVPGIARVHVDTWRTAYAGLVPDEVLTNQSYKQREDIWQNILTTYADTNYVNVADVAGQIVGFVWGGKLRDETPGYSGELYAIYLLQNTQGQGLGRRLVEALLCDLIEQGHTSMLVWVFRDNPPARGFYEALGGQYVSEKTFELGGKEFVEVSYGWQDIRPLVAKSE